MKASNRKTQAVTVALAAALAVLSGTGTALVPRLAHAAATVRFKAGEIIVMLNPLAGATIEQINATYGTTVLEGLPSGNGTYRLRAPDGANPQTLATTMALDIRLAFAEPNYIAESPEANPRNARVWGGANAGPYTGQYAPAMLGLSQAQAIHKGAGVYVAVIDTGVQLNHNAMTGGWTAARFDFVDNDSYPYDDKNGIDDDDDGVTDEAYGHGTHVAGIIHLVAPEAKIMPIRALDAEGSGDEWAVAKAIDFAVANGANVINLSLGMSEETEMLNSAVKRATQASVVVVASAGNQASSAPQYPAEENCTLAIASIGQTDLKSEFSNFGDWIDFTAPGEGIYSPSSISGYAWWSGTSMATPFVAGQVALIRGKRPTLKVREIANLIADSAKDIDNLNAAYEGSLGKGRIQIGASLALLNGSYEPDDSGHGLIGSSCVEPEVAVPRPAVAPTVADATRSPNGGVATDTPEPLATVDPVTARRLYLPVIKR